MSTPEIVYDKGKILIVNKPAGMPSQPDLTSDKSVLDFFKDTQEERLHVVHRVDRPVSGLVAMARNRKAAALWQSLLQKKGLKREYIAIVEGHPEKDGGRLIHGLRHDTKNHKARIIPVDDKRAKVSVLDYTVIERGDRYTALHVILDTGRFHQIRVQLADLGHPIRGDVKYGARRSLKDRSIDLCAWKLSWDNRVVVSTLPTAGPWELVQDWADK